VADGRAFETLTRIGFAARGLVYGLIGYLALRSGRTEDPNGVFEYLESGAGTALLAAMAVGFFAYALWRLLDAWVDPEGKGGKPSGLGARIARAGSGLVHLGFGGAAALHAFGRGGGGGRSSGEQGAQAALTLPGGHILLFAAAALFLGIGIAQLRKAWSLSFMRHLAGSGEARPWLCWLGRAGYATRGAVFTVIAYLFWRAARDESSREAGGIADALQSLPTALQTAVAAGLILFGLFSLAEGWYRRIDGRVTEKVSV
jgi:hypothetical protein